MKILLFIIILSAASLCADVEPEEDPFFLGQYYLLQEDYTQAEANFLLALEKDPDSIEIYTTLIDLSLDSNDYEKTLHYVLKASSIAPQEDKFIDLAINLYVYMEQPDSAIRFIERKIQESPEDIDLQVKKLTLLVTEYKWKEVIELCVEILLKTPDDQEIFQTMLEIGFRTQDFDSIFTGLDTLMSNFPENPLFMGSYIRILYSISNSDQVLTELWTLNDRFPHHNVILNQLAQQLSDLGKFASSDSIYQQLINRDDPDANALNNYAYNLSTRQNITEQELDKALEYGCIALELFPDNASFLDTIGWIYYQMDQFELAEHFLLESLKTEQSNAVIFEHLSDVYVRIKQIDKAVKALDSAISIDSENDLLKAKRKNLGHE